MNARSRKESIGRTLQRMKEHPHPDVRFIADALEKSAKVIIEQQKVINDLRKMQREQKTSLYN